MIVLCRVRVERTAVQWLILGVEELRQSARPNNAYIGNSPLVAGVSREISSAAPRTFLAKGTVNTSKGCGDVFCRTAHVFGDKVLGD